jgi:putative hydrolase of the HAD superfamily
MRGKEEISKEALMRLYENFVFDLDNTLYDERRYLDCAYRTIAEHIAKSTYHSASILVEYLKNTFEEQGRHQLFDKFLAQFNLPKEQWLSKLLEILRTVEIKESLPLFPKMSALLESLEVAGKRVFVLTNGNVVQQRNKINSLNWPIVIPANHIYMADDYERKPSPRCLFVILDSHSLTAGDTVFIGDSMEDQQCACAAGTDFYNVHSLK